MRISAVIPIYNARQTIARCLESLISQARLPDEIVLVDNGSTDGSYEAICDFQNRHPHLRIKAVREEKRGSDAARNTGIAQASGEVVAFTDSDCVVHKDWLKEIEAGYENDAIAGVAGSIYGFRPTGTIQKFSSIYTLRTPEEAKTYEKYNVLSGGFASANLSFRKGVLERLGGFDASIDQGADHDLCRRVLSGGLKIKYNPKAMVYHIHRPSLAGFLYQSYRYGTAHSHLLRKNGRGLIIELPGYVHNREDFPFPAWLNLNYADKKVLFVLLLGFLAWPVFLFAPAYLLYLSMKSAQKAKLLGINLTLFEWLLMGPLLVMKSAALTVGRLRGSIKYGVVCF